MRLRVAPGVDFANVLPIAPLRQSKAAAFVGQVILRPELVNDGFHFVHRGTRCTRQVIRIDDNGPDTVFVKVDERCEYLRFLIHVVARACRAPILLWVCGAIPGAITTGGLVCQISGVRRTFRNCTLPWSPWSIIGPASVSLASNAPPVIPGTSPLSMILVPFRITVTRLAIKVIS
jgi:hypothetical protein